MAQLITVTRNKIFARDPATGDRLDGVDLRYNRLVLPVAGGLVISGRNLEETCRIGATILAKGRRVLSILYEDGVLDLNWGDRPKADWLAMHFEGRLLFHSECRDTEGLAAHEPTPYDHLEVVAGGSTLTPDILDAFRATHFAHLPMRALVHEDQTAVVLSEAPKAVQCSVLLRSTAGQSKVSFTLQQAEDENRYASGLSFAADVVAAATEAARRKRVPEGDRTVAVMRGQEKLSEIRVKFHRMVGNGRVRFWPEMPEFLVA